MYNFKFLSINKGGKVVRFVINDITYSVTKAMQIGCGHNGHLLTVSDKLKAEILKGWDIKCKEGYLYETRLQSI